MMGFAPSDFKSFSEIFNIFNEEFKDNAIPRHSPASGPKSLSFKDKYSYTNKYSLLITMNLYVPMIYS